jgi:hypothetical protein
MSDILKEAKEFEHCHEHEHCNADGIIEDLLDYISRLEAAYLAAKKDSLEWNALDEEEIDQMTRESLERIRNGSNS